LARAFHAIGRAAFADTWVETPYDNEPDEPEEPDDNCDAETEDRYELAYENWERACAQAKIDFANMWANVTQKIAEACKAGTLVSAVRAKEGGEFIRLEAHCWNTENLTVRFFRCDMTLSSPFEKRQSHRSHWIYVTRDSLDKYLGKSPATDAVMQSDSSHEPASDTSSRRSLLPASKTQIRKVANKIYADPVNDRPNVIKAWELIKKELPDAKRDRVLEVIKESAFASQRRPAGNQSKPAVSRRR
jgi:hypothetical protein